MITRIYRAGFTLIAIVCLCGWIAIPKNLNLWRFDDHPYGFASEPQLIEDFSECTTGLASGLATPDGCPLLWKNRDVPSPTQEYHYVDHGGFPFIGLTYENDIAKYFAGINSVGFGIENSDAGNFPGPNAPGDQDDGATMSVALSTCQTVDDFQEILDSMNVNGRTRNYNYGTFDALGGAAMFECAGFSYTRFDAIEQEHGFMIRSNFSYTGSDTSDDDYSVGISRHDRAYIFWKAAVENNNLTPHYIYQQVVRDLACRECDPYPLPFDGYYQNYLYGRVPVSYTHLRAHET